MPSKKNFETSDSNTEIFFQLVRRGGVERKLHHDFKQLYWELAGCFAMVVHPVLCLALAVSRYFIETDQKFSFDLHIGKFFPYLKCKKLAFLYTARANSLFQALTVCESLGTLHGIFQNTPLYVFSSATR